MNEPTPHFVPDDLGPLDEHGQQIWSPEEEAAIARLVSEPWYLESLTQANADIAAGRYYTHEEVVARSEDRRRRWRAEHGL